MCQPTYDENGYTLPSEYINLVSQKLLVIEETTTEIKIFRKL